MWLAGSQSFIQVYTYPLWNRSFSVEAPNGISNHTLCVHRTFFPTSTIVEYYPLITKPPGKLTLGPQNSDMSQISNAVNMMIIDRITIAPSCLLLLPK